MVPKKSLFDRYNFYKKRDAKHPKILVYLYRYIYIAGIIHVYIAV